MKPKRILLDLSLNYGLGVMEYESDQPREKLSVNHPELANLSIREFCMLSREKLLLAYGMAPDKVAAIERLLSEYSLRLGMPDTELETYQNLYYQENPKEKEFYDLCDRLCGNLATFDEKRFRNELLLELNSSPLSGNKLNDLGWQRYQTIREAYLRQPWFLRWFGSSKTRIRKAIGDATVIHDMFCRLVTENCIATERWHFEQREMNKIKG